MSALSIDLLGSPRFVKNGHHAPLVRAKGVAVLLYLAVTRTPQPRDRLLDLLWPDSLPDAARKNLRNTLWTIREVLGEEVIEAASDTLSLSDSVAVDLHRLEDAVAHPQEGDVSALESAAEHYRGPLADGLMLREAPDFEIWLTAERERVSALYLRLLSQIVALHRSAGEWERVILFAQRALAVDPLREPAHVAMIEAMLRLGRRSQAVRQYEALVAILERELAVAPLPETSERYHALLAAPDAGPVQPAPPQPPVPSPRDPGLLVGRRDELDTLDAARVRAASGQARAVLISGDLGMGKSRLWRAWAGMHAADTTFLVTHAIETGEPVPFGPVNTLFRQPGPAHDLLRPPTPLAPIWLAELARLMPEIRSAWPHLAPPLGVAPAEGRGRLFQALTEAIRALIQTRTHRHPLVLVVDDLHWADPSTLDWLVFLVDRLPDLPLLLLGAYRPQDAPARLSALAAAWQRQDRLDTISLPPLSPEEAHTLLQSLAVSSIASTGEHHDEWVHLSGGNPYFLIELARMGTGEPPADLAALVRARLGSTLPDSALQTLQAAAVLGTVDEVELLRATSGRTEEETLDGLDALIAAGVLVALPEGGYGFAQPLVAAIVRQEFTPARRAFLHRRAASALEPGDPGEAQGLAGRLMGHFAGAGDLKRAAAYAELAARHALSLSAFGEAVLYAQRALAWEESPERHLLLGQALWVAESAGGAEAELEAALSGFEQAGDVAGAIRAGTDLARLAVHANRPDVARARLQQMPAPDLTTGPALAVEGYLLAAGAARQSEAYAEAGSRLDAAERLARAGQMTALLGQIAFERGNLLANSGDLKGALSAFEIALREARGQGDPVLEAMALNNLAFHALLAGDLPRADKDIRLALDVTERYALNFLQQYVQSSSGEIALAQGRLDAAGTAFSLAEQAARTWDNRIHVANVRVNQALLAEARGDLPGARALLEEASALFEGAADPFVRDKIAHARSRLG